MSTVVFRRPPRWPAPQFPRDELVLASPPELPEEPPGRLGRLLILLPLLCGVGALAFLYAGRGGGPMTYVAGGLFGVSLLGLAIGRRGGGTDGRRAELDAGRRAYLRHLGQMRRRARRAAAQQRAALVWRYPEPDALWSLAATPRMWERRPTEDDFGQVRVAVGPQQLAVGMVTPETRPIGELDPVSASALRRFVRAHSTVPGLPIALSLRGFSRVVLRGDRDSVTGLARAMAGGLATFHAPDDLTVAVVAAPERQAEWDWVKWLPHAQHARAADAAGGRRLVFASLADLEELLGAELTGRLRHHTPATPLRTAPHLLVLLDGGEVPATSQLSGAGLLDSTVIDLSGAVPGDAGQWLLRLDVSPSTVEGVLGDQVIPLGRPDRLDTNQAEALARTLSPYRLAPPTGALHPYLAPGTGEPGAAPVRHQVVPFTTAAVAVPEPPLAPGPDQPDESPPPHEPPPPDEPPSLDTLLPTLVTDRYFGLHPEGWPQRGRLVAPVGRLDEPLEQRRDPMYAHLDGAGGHVAIVGGPQSGKSTMLRSLLASLALTHTSWEVQFLGLDLDGGGLDALVELPHVSGVTGGGDAEAVRRTVAGMSTLLDERAARFARDHVESIAAYRAQRGAGELRDDPFGDVFLVIDGWNTLGQEYPDLAPEITTIAGRGLDYGVHVVLTAGRWSEIPGDLRELLATRWELRLDEVDESEIDRRLAADVPRESPGRGLSTGKLHFRSALPRVDGQSGRSDLGPATAALVSRVRAAWPYAPAPKIGG